MLFSQFHDEYVNAHNIEPTPIDAFYFAWELQQSRIVELHRKLMEIEKHKYGVGDE